jgi:flagellar protein FlgJ
MSPEDFVAKVKPYADKAAERLGVDSRVLIAQAALETGWGRHVIHRESGESSFNLFNIKAGSDWQQDQVSVSTIEFNQGVARHEQAQFRVYPDMAASFEDYTSFIGERQRYAGAVEKAENPYAYLKELQAAGYATDPDYADKVWRVFNSDAVQQATDDVVTARKD